MIKPVVVVLSKDEDEVFEWMSGGWHTQRNRHTQEAKDLHAKATKCIKDGVDMQDARRRLEEAGFELE